MNTRRNFLKGLVAIAGAAVALPNVLVAEAKDRFQWKRSAEGIWVLNPTYMDTPWDIEFYPAAETTYRIFDKWSICYEDNLAQSRFLHSLRAALAKNPQLT